jgi:hypothetical protein
MKKYLFLLLLPVMFLATSQRAEAQYDNAIGLRLGPSWGITFKHKLSDAAGLEFLLNSHWGGYQVTAMYEHHIPVITDGMNVYFGGGAHVGFYSYNSRYDRYWNNYGGGMYVGLDGILGLEYTFSEVPINLSLDWKPAFNFLGNTGFWGDGGALSVRYAF